MLKILKVIVTSIIIVLFSAEAIVTLSEARGALGGIDNAINKTVIKASRLFEENQGEPMSTDFKLLEAKQDSYFQALKITKDYKIVIKFTDGAETADNHTTNLPKALWGRDILLLPVYNQGDEKITSWECITNIDKDIPAFREISSNTYLSLCVYMDKKPL